LEGCDLNARERLLSPKAAIRSAKNREIRPSAYGQERTLARLAKKGFFRAMIRKKEDAYDLY